MLERLRQETRSRILESISGIEASPKAATKTDRLQLRALPSLPKWQNYDLLAAAVIAADE